MGISQFGSGIFLDLTPQYDNIYFKIDHQDLDIHLSCFRAWERSIVCLNLAIPSCLAKIKNKEQLYLSLEKICQCFANGSFTQLRSLDLSYVLMNPYTGSFSLQQIPGLAKGLEAIAAMLPHLPHLQHLVLTGTALRASYKHAIIPILGSNPYALLSSAVGNHPSLQRLDIDACKLSSEDGPALLPLFTSSVLQTLNLAHNKLGKEKGVMEEFGKALASNTSLTALTLSNNGLLPRGMTAFATSLSLQTSLTALYLGDNPFFSSAGKSMKTLLTHCTGLSTLCLRSAGADNLGIAHSTVRYLIPQNLRTLSTHLPQLSGLMTLNLGGAFPQSPWPSGQFPSALFSTFFEQLSQCTNLTELDLSRNCLDNNPVSLELLVKFLSGHPSLTTLNLSQNVSRFQPRRSLEQHCGELLEKNSILQTLILTENGESEGHISKLAQGLSVNSTLSSLYLDRTRIGDVGALHLTQALQQNSSLVALSLTGCEIGEEGVTALADHLAANPAIPLMTLKLSHNAGTDAILRPFEQLLVAHPDLIDLSLPGGREVRLGQQLGTNQNNYKMKYSSLLQLLLVKRGEGKREVRRLLED